MSLTYGFYDSINKDRVYTAKQMCAIFDGVIHDGVFAEIGKKFAVSPVSNMTIKVGDGRAWFDHTWTYLDADMQLTVSAAHTSYSRIDAVVLEVDSSDSKRENSIKIVKGTATTNPVRPTLTNSDTVHQHAIAYISIPPATTAIVESMIENVVGTSDTPFVTSILETTNVDYLMSQWDGQFHEWLDHLHNELDSNQASNLQNQLDKLSGKLSSYAAVDAVGVPVIELITKTKNWTAPNDIVGKVKAYVFGAGGGGGGGATKSTNYRWIYCPGGGGGGGHLAIGAVEVNPGQIIRAVIGQGGTAGVTTNTSVTPPAAPTDGGNGGYSSFGTIRAEGGDGGKKGHFVNDDGYCGDGGNGGTGGGGATSLSSIRGGNGGNASYGGGGGGGYPSGNGGNGGKYGGGGAGAGAAVNNPTSYGNGGTGGEYGGDGGHGRLLRDIDADAGSAGSSFYSNNDTSAEVYGISNAGNVLTSIGGAVSTYSESGGSGGGYGSKGGDGLAKDLYYYSAPGGGGFVAHNTSDPYINGDRTPYSGGAGFGRGSFGKIGKLHHNNNDASAGGGGGGYLSYACGGNGGIGDRSQDMNNAENGANGIIILIYHRMINSELYLTDIYPDNIIVNPEYPDGDTVSY